MKRYFGTATWVLAGGFAVLLGAFLARGARTFFEPAKPMVPVSEAVAAQAVAAQAVATKALVTSASATAVGPNIGADLVRPAEAERRQAESVRPGKAKAASRRSIRLDEIPTE